MTATRPNLQITTAQWNAYNMRGLAAAIDDRPYVLTSYDSVEEPTYNRVTIIGTRRAA